MKSTLIDILAQVPRPSITKAGWCLREGMEHILSVDEGRMLPLVEEHGLPTFYLREPNKCRHAPTQNIKDPSNCFESLCRIVTGQSVSGVVAQAVWKRLLETVDQKLTPAQILAIEDVSEKLQKPAGLSRAKTRALVDLAEHFERGDLSEEFLTQSPLEVVRTRLLAVKGIGPWSCDMFCMFYLEHGDVLPMGDLGVRKGISRHFGMRGSAHQGHLCPKKDLGKVESRLDVYHPYLSLVTYYMWRVADAPMPTPQSPLKTDEGKVVSKKKKRPSPSESRVPGTTATPVKRKCATRHVTP